MNRKILQFVLPWKPLDVFQIFKCVVGQLGRVYKLHSKGNKKKKSDFQWNLTFAGRNTISPVIYIARILAVITWFCFVDIEIESALHYVPNFLPFCPSCNPHGDPIMITRKFVFLTNLLLSTNMKERDFVLSRNTLRRQYHVNSHWCLVD